ncbi:hypothetical protein ATKI12_6603 [Kitasatospora sp. Ki12]
MARITEQTRARNEEAIRAAMDRLLRGDLPDGGRCDLKTLAVEAGVTRTAFYPKKTRDGSSRPGPYQHLAEEFTRRQLKAMQASGVSPDPRDTHITRLKDANAALAQRLQAKEQQIKDLTTFRQLALSRIAAQQLEIERLRAQHPPQAQGSTHTALRSVPEAPEPVISVTPAASVRSPESDSAGKPDTSRTPL